MTRGLVVRDFLRPSAISSAFVAVAVGMAVVLPLIIQSGRSTGASEAQIASFVIAVCIAMAIESAFLSTYLRMPIVCATSTAGVALVAQSAGYTVHEMSAAYILSAVFLVLTGLFKPFTRLVSSIPSSVAAGMLAGVLLPFVLAVPQTLADAPVFVGTLMAGFFVLRLFNGAAALILILLAGIIWSLLFVPETPSTLSFGWPVPVWIAPAFTPQALVGLAIPLYLVTMASQNLPGLAVLRTDAYQAPPGVLIGATGFVSLLTAPFGAVSTALAAITAALCTGPDAHPDPEKRWVTGVWYGFFYALFALFGVSLTALFTALPAVLIALIVGLGLLSPLINATRIALGDETQRIAAMVTLATTASGVGFLGIASAFWGLIAGLAVIGLDKIARK